MQNQLHQQSNGDEQQNFNLQQQLLGMNAFQQGNQAQQLSMLQQMRNGSLGDGLHQGDMGGQNLSIQQMLQLRNLQQQEMAHQQVFGGAGMGGGMLGGGNNEMLMQLLQQQQQQQLPQSFGGAQLGFGGFGSPDGIGSNQLALERDLLLRQQQQGAHQGMHGNDHLFASGLGGGGHFGGGIQDSNNQLLLQLLQQQQLQQQQLQANIQMAESVGSNQMGQRAGSAPGNRGASHSGVAAPEAPSPKAIKKKTYKKRPKDKPKRPLSAYNFFFKEERARILGAAAAAAAAAEDKEQEGSKGSENDEDKTESNGKDGEKGDDEKGSQRKGRSRPHGKISFEDLGRLISQRWQELNPEEVDYYKKKSDDDRKRYQEEMDEYRKKKAGN